jgi:hypothetical protein
MIAKLHQLESGTVFSHDGLEWEKGSTMWENPRKGYPEVTPEMVGKQCMKCYPKLGGRFQHQLGKWFPIETEVTVS